MSDQDDIKNLKIFIAKLPTPGGRLFGREDELKMLDEAWADEDINIFSLVAWGGVGKTSLVNEWLNQMGQDDYRGAEHVYGWSFYSQGTREDRQVSGDEFLAHALKWFGDDKPEKGFPWDKGQRLAKLIRRQRTLLILDGLEPLQYPPGEMQGHLEDSGLKDLLKELAHSNPGLCVVSTRVQVEDIEHTGSTRRVFLENLSEQAGMQLLREMGVTKGTNTELQEAAKEYGGHALTLSLLGKYLAIRYGGEIKERGTVERLAYKREKQGKHAWQVMKSYQIWLKGKPELDILYLMGLFDRPAEGTAIKELRRKPEIQGLTELQNLSEEDWDFAVNHLRDLQLLAARNDYHPDTLDCHPLVREHFGQELRHLNAFSWKQPVKRMVEYFRLRSGRSSTAWQQAHSRLYEYYKEQASEYPDTFEEMAPLYAAISHGCQAGRYQEALDEVFIKRIRRGNMHFSLFQLGAVGADLSALANFFIQRFTEPIENLDILKRAYVLNEVGSAYRILGRPYQAIDLINRSFEIYLSKYNYRINAARSARNLSKTYMQIGRLEEAIKLAEKAINLTDKSTELLMDRYISHANLGRALHLFGKLDDARRNFEESQKLKAEIGRSHSEQSLWGDRFTLQETHYCDLLAEENNTEIALALLDSIPQTTKDVLGVLDYALYHYSRGKVSLIQSQKQGAQNYRVAREHLDEAIENLKRAMRQDELGFAYLARSLLHRLRGNLSMARSDLNAAQEIAERGSIKILLADCYLEACHLQLARFEPGGATRDLDKAKTLVEEMGYDRRKKEIMELDEAINPK